MKTLSTLALTLLMTAGTLFAGQSVDVTIRADSDAFIEIDNLSGSVTITGWDQNEVRVTGTLGDDTEGLSTSGEGSHITIEVEIPDRYRGRGRRDYESSLQISVPANARLEVETVSARIDVSDVTGQLDLESVSGSVEVTGSPSSADVETVSGGITISGAQTQVNAESVSGNVRLSGVADRVEVATVSGRIEVDAGNIDRADFETVSGNITVSGSLDSGASFDLECHSGNVDLLLPADTSATWEISSFSGEINNDFGPAAKRTSKYAPGKWLEFSTGSGSADVSIETFSGNVYLRKK
jgi:DUF4097 and DUF4098 domain-containing protein YvlB